MRKFLHYLHIAFTAFCGVVAVLLVIAAAVQISICLPEFLRRWHLAQSGALGEGADWGEPAFYMVVSGVLMGLPGALIGLSLFPFLRHWRWHFSLRTLLIAITLVAVALGLMVWTVSK